MNLTVYSQNRIRQTFATWDVPQGFARPMYDYLIYGHQPGSCFTAVLANDFMGAMGSSHSSNTVEAFKSLAGWIGDTLPISIYGSYDKVDAWCDMPAAMRRPILENHGLIYTEKEEVWMILKDEKTVQPILY